jgi:hypothetical protein
MYAPLFPPICAVCPSQTMKLLTVQFPPVPCYLGSLRPKYLSQPHDLYSRKIIRVMKQRIMRLTTGYGLDGPGIESRWGARFSAPVQTGPRVHPSSCKMGTGSFPGVESGRGMTLTPHPLVVPRSKNRVELYLYSP